ncbi:MAG: hypothetical protein P9L95_10340 [Candidatus Tenebribacter mawsonii]|nr:hypothetical protein [Candidatus Tenebribacter mawsonii]
MLKRSTEGVIDERFKDTTKRDATFLSEEKQNLAALKKRADTTWRKYTQSCIGYFIKGK